MAQLTLSDYKNNLFSNHFLEERIQETDKLIDAIVFDLCDLTEKEVETVLDSLDTEDGEKGRILEKFRRR